MRCRTLQKWVRNYKTLCTYNPIIEDLKQYDLDLNMSSSVDEMQDFTEMSEQLKDNLYKPIIEDWQQQKKFKPLNFSRCTETLTETSHSQDENLVLTYPWNEL